MNDKYIQTYSGIRFWPLDPRIEDINLEDIAHALSMQCRFSGHTSFHYSVAQHSLIVSEYCKPENALAGLLHDASEAYLIDVPRPIKPHLIGYADAEDKIMKLVSQKFGFEYPFDDEIKELDLKVLYLEKQQLLKELTWSMKFPETKIENYQIKKKNPEDVKFQFLDKFLKITKSR